MGLGTRSLKREHHDHPQLSRLSGKILRGAGALLLKCSHRANRAWLPSACGSSIHVDLSGYDQIPPVSTLQLPNEAHLLLSADGFAREGWGESICEAMSFTQIAQFQGGVIVVTPQM